MNPTSERIYSIRHPNHKNIALQVTPAAERKLRQGHPWLFDQAIRKQSQTGQPGDLAIIFDQKRRFLAAGLYDPYSPIRVRVLQHHQPATIDAGWFQQKILAAFHARADIPENTNGFRLIHGENDGLPGLVLDQYARTWVLKIYSACWIPYLADLLPLWANSAPERILLKLSREVAARPEALFGLKDGDLIYGTPINSPILFQENGLTFEADPIHGHKTGFYLDQRDNRARVEALSTSADVLNIFAYTGGFSLYAARGGAKTITSVDISQLALDAAERNFAHNQQHPNIQAAKHIPICGDAFGSLTQLFTKNQRYDLVIIDPPSFAKSRAEIQSALRAYQRLTRLGLQVLKPGGILVQASCSSRISSESFYIHIHQAAMQMGVILRQLESSGHPSDHPIGFPEGEYLKCLFAIKEE